MKSRRRRPINQGRYAKEGTLIALSLFYFVIATNTQTGWLFVLSAFLLGLLVTAWLSNRKTIESLQVSCTRRVDPTKDTPFRFTLELRNVGKKPISEVRLECEAPTWALEESSSVHVTPQLAPNQVVSLSVVWTPKVRGEHCLTPSKVSCGAPFGLFVRTKSWDWPQTFLIYPSLERLPTRGKSAFTTAYLSDAVARRGTGDSNTLKGVRDYRPGDDLRQVHWKASAKRGPGSTLLVREHLAPAPSSTTYVLDTSCPESENTALFEKAVSLTASALWSAHKEGVSAKLLLRGPGGQWTLWNHWTEQYVALARVQRDRELNYQDWVSDSEDSHHFGGGRTRPAPTLIKAGDSAVDYWPTWLRRVLVCVEAHDTHPILQPGPEVTLVPLDSQAPMPHDRNAHV